MYITLKEHSRLNSVLDVQDTFENVESAIHSYFDCEVDCNNIKRFVYFASDVAKDHKV